MDIQIRTKSDIINMEPVVVTAPTGRNGITLVQRLLNSSKEIIVYGENAHLLSTAPNVVASIMQNMKGKQEFDQALRNFLEGETEGWTSNLWPELTGYIGIAFENAFRYFEYYQNFSKDKGYSQWGIKNPMTSRNMIDNIRILLKRIRVIFIYRNLFDVVRSAKARKFVKNLAQVGSFARQWQEHLLPVLKKEIKGVLCIQYEKLIANPELDIQRLERFAKVQGIDRAVMERKFNTFKGDTKFGLSPEQYIPPEELTQEEVEVISETAAEALALTGYQPLSGP